MVRTGEVNPAPAAAPCLFPGLRERECVGVLPVKSLMREGGGGERKREGHCQMQGGNREEGARTRARTHTVRLCVQGGMRKGKQRSCHSCKNIPLCQQVPKSEQTCGNMPTS